MESGYRIFICLVMYVWGVGALNADQTVGIWPMPAFVSFGSTTLRLATDFHFTSSSGLTWTLHEAFHRYKTTIFTNTNNSTNEEEEEEAAVLRDYTLRSLIVDLDSADETAATVYGALRGLETFSQLCSFNFEKQSYQIKKTPWSISDYPRFGFRGLLLDTARHYQPVAVIKQVIDAMSFAKFNVLHWHPVDSEAFPLEIPSYRKLWNGAYSSAERYTFADTAEIVRYAQRRGIHVMLELDLPGHARSWGIGYNKLWPSTDCKEPLDISKDFTFKVINGAISDLSKAFTFDFFHLGGDEVDTSCWSDTPTVSNWLKEQNMTTEEAYKSFVLRAQSIALSHNYTPVNWEETFNHFGNQLDNRTIIHNWISSGRAPSIVKAGFRCIVSNQDMWYLDHLSTTWEQFYSNEPLEGIQDPAQQELVIGGEVCMWGETVDPSDIHSTIWPRAAAAAERLWSSTKQIATEPHDALPRLHQFRCLLTRRGIGAAPLLVDGRSSPESPGSCLLQ